MHLHNPGLANLYSIPFLILTINILAAPNFSPDSSPQSLPHTLSFRAESPPPIHSSALSVPLRETSLSKRQRLTAEQLWTRLRLGTLWIFWSWIRVTSITNPNPEPPGKFILQLKSFYTSIRADAIGIWAQLPEQSYVKIVYGQLVFLLLPPADRTVPWSVVEEASYSLLLLVSAGLGGLVTGMYFPMVSSVVTLYYLQVIMPVPEGQGGGGGGGGRGSNPAYPNRPPRIGGRRL